ncbi:protein DOG1-like 1 [Chenopodium quinoa]|uniref:DOG1 domain-containing protein n=1 Tax=Chenopodium quinoa TaxID=63459 RepID=A0A803KNE1_CHEQI|nr:protein DOG1-like 1 [Chenopodium quinoa]
MVSEVLDDLLVLQELDRKAFMSKTKESDIEWTPNLTKLVNRVITHYENHYRVESDLIKDSVQVLLLLSHVWPSYLEDAFLWVGGWRPSIAFHLLDFNPEVQLGVEVSELLKGVGMRQFKDILPSQLVRVDELQRLTIQAENELTRSLAEPISPMESSTKSSSDDSMMTEVYGHGNLGEIFGKADDLRLKTLKNLVQILSPIQAVQLFIPAAQLHLKVHTWGKNKERAHTRRIQHEHDIAEGGGSRKGGLESRGGVFETLFLEQQRDLEELKLAAKAYTESTQSSAELTQNLQGLVSIVICHYENYYRVKSELAKQNIFCMITPAWRSLLEHAFLWIGGCRPSTTFHLLYTIAGLHVKSGLSKLLDGSSKTCDLGWLSPSQLTRVDELQMNTIKEERELSEKLASFQETMADSSMVELSREATESKARDRVGTVSIKKRVELTLGHKEDKLKEIFRKANDLRMKTLKKVVEVLSPIQAVDFLIAAAELHLRVREWGKDKDADQQQH